MTMYKLMEAWSPPMGGLIQRIVNLDTGAVFPPDPNNLDYQQYLIWLAEGNEPLPAD